MCPDVLCGSVPERFAESGIGEQCLQSTAQCVDVEVGGPSYWAIASQLTPWLHYIDVLGPSEVRAHLAEFGRQLVARFG